MTCKQVQRQLDSFIDGELSPESMVSLRRHFESCIGCSQEFQALQILKKEVGTLSAPIVDSSFEDRLLSHVLHTAAQRPERIRRRFQLASFAAAMAAALTLATVQTLADQRRTNQQTQENRIELKRNEAFVAAENPLSGGSMMMPASYGR